MTEKPTKSKFETSYTLLDRVQDPDDQQAWDDFVSFYDQYIYNVLRKANIPKSDTSDLCQEIMLRLWKKLPEFAYNRDRGKFRSWLTTMVRNESSRFFTKNKGIANLLNDEDDSLDNRIDPHGNLDLESMIAEEWDHHISKLAFESLKTQFSENTLKVFILHVEGKSKEEIAEACNIKERSVKTYILRIRDHLKERMDKLNKELL